MFFTIQPIEILQCKTIWRIFKLILRDFKALYRIIFKIQNTKMFLPTPFGGDALAKTLVFYIIINVI